jgi:hypothetical protein
MLRRSMRFVATIAVLASLALLSVAGTAIAQSPTEDAYGGGDKGEVGGVQQSNGGGGDTNGAAAAVATDTTGGSLPFTGLEVGVMLLAGVALVGGGFLVRRISNAGGPLA